MSKLLELQVRRQGTWRRVSWSMSQETIATEANLVYRGSRRTAAVRVLDATGAQVLFLGAARR
jgi:hypothetical protein